MKYLYCYDVNSYIRNPYKKLDICILVLKWRTGLWIKEIGKKIYNFELMHMIF